MTTEVDKALEVLNAATGKLADPKECAKTGHYWKMAVHQESYRCEKCGAAGFYDFERNEVTDDEKRAKASLEHKVVNKEPVMPVQGQGSLRDFDNRTATPRPQRAPAGFAK